MPEILPLLWRDPLRCRGDRVILAVVGLYPLVALLDRSGRMVFRRAWRQASLKP